MSLETEDMKRKVIALEQEGLSYRAISAITDIPKSTIGDFLNRDTYKSWWADTDLSEDPDESYQPEDGPVIGLIDIETSPIIATTWGLFNQNIGINQILTDTEIMCASVKMLGGDETLTISSQDYFVKGEVKAMERAVLALWAFLDNCDIIVAHNGRRFDNKRIRAKLKEWKLPPPSPYKVVDTLEIAKKQFAFTSNKKDFLSKKLGSDGKMETGGMKLWLDCMDGDLEAWDKMHSYCEKDVDELEVMYLEFRGWDNKHPNLQLYYNDDKVRCGNCGSENVEEVENRYAYTGVSKFELLRCGDCGNYRRKRSNIRTKDQRKNTTMNIV